MTSARQAVLPLTIAGALETNTYTLPNAPGVPEFLLKSGSPVQPRDRHISSLRPRRRRLCEVPGAHFHPCAPRMSSCISGGRAWNPRAGHGEERVHG